MLWGCSGNDAVTIDIDKFEIISSRPLTQNSGEDDSNGNYDDGSKVVHLVTRVGNGVWVTYNGECSLHLFHLETLMRLQEIDLSRIIRDFKQDIGSDSELLNEHQSHITSMQSSHGQLYVGTNTGLLLAMPLPKLPDSVPKITGPCKVCRHSLNGAVSFLIAPAFPTTSFMSYNNNTGPPLPKRDDLADSQHSDSDTNDNPNPPQPTREHLSLPRPTRKASFRKYLPSPISPLDDPTYGQLTEDKKLYEHVELQAIESLQKPSSVDWGDPLSRQCPVVLACGRGYKCLHPKSSHSKFAAPNDARFFEQPVVLCWKAPTL